MQVQVFHFVVTCSNYEHCYSTVFEPDSLNIYCTAGFVSVVEERLR